MTITTECLHQISAFCFVVIPLITPEKWALPANGWMPYNHSASFLHYLSTYIIQSLAITVSATTNVGTDAIINGFIMEILAQLDILHQRLSTSCDKPTKLNSKFLLQSEKLINNVRHHNAILRYNLL